VVGLTELYLWRLISDPSARQLNLPMSAEQRRQHLRPQTHRTYHRCRATYAGCGISYTATIYRATHVTRSFLSYEEDHGRNVWRTSALNKQRILISKPEITPERPIALRCSPASRFLARVITFGTKPWATPTAGSSIASLTADRCIQTMHSHVHVANLTIDYTTITTMACRALTMQHKPMLFDDRDELASRRN
jgi:hypothetical protein